MSALFLCKNYFSKMVKSHKYVNKVFVVFVVFVVFAVLHLIFLNKKR